MELIDLRTISPLDEATLLKSVAKTKRAVVVHEAVRKFGVGAEIAALLHEQLFGELRAPVRFRLSGDAVLPGVRTHAEVTPR